MGNKSNSAQKRHEINDFDKVNEINEIEDIQTNKGQKMKSSPPKVVVGIDMGTSGIGYAYSFYNNQNQIILSDFNCQSPDKKVPTEIILDKDLNDVLAFGNECLGYILFHDKNIYEYFKNIKMNLYKKIYIIKSTNGKEANIENIFAKILKKFLLKLFRK